MNDSQLPENQPETEDSQQSGSESTERKSWRERVSDWIESFATLSWKRVVAIAGIIAVAGLILLLVFIAIFATDLPSLEQLETYEPRLVTSVLDRNGAVLKEFYTEKRVQVPLDSLSPHLIDAVLATEDQRYFKHWGVDPLGIVRAALVNFTSMSTEQGASTLTQQLARQLHLNLQQTLKRKIREAITAVQMERTYAKDEILAMYFTQMYFGHGAYGAEAASQLYFNKSATELNLPEAAMIVGLLKAPNNYTPYRYPERAKDRRDTVLGMMRSSGYISKTEYQEAIATPIELAGDEADQLGTAPYFTEWVRQKLNKLGNEYGFDYYEDGLTVETTLDSTLQVLADSSMRMHITEWQEKFEETRARSYVDDILREEFTDSLLASGFKQRHSRLDSAAYARMLHDSVLSMLLPLIQDSALVDSVIKAKLQVQVAFVAMDPNTGDVLAMIGGRDFHESKFNRAVQAERQPGSVFKPFVYATAVDNGIYGNHLVLNMVQPVLLGDSTWWRPENYDVSNRGDYVTMREALKRSLNNVTVRLVAGDDRVIPIRAVIQTAHRMGIRTDLDPVPALALGANAVIPLDIVTAYGVFASGGTRNNPRAIRQVLDRNHQEILSVPVEREVVLSEETAAIMRDMLSDVVDRGTGASARWKYEFYAPAAGKTGTTNNFNNAWFVGFTPNLVAGVWVGFDDPSISLGPGQSGSVVALPIWARFMKWAYEARGWPHTEFDLPVGVVEVEVDAETGLRAGPLSSQTYTELFRREDVPPPTR